MTNNIIASYCLHADNAHINYMLKKNRYSSEAVHGSHNFF